MSAAPNLGPQNPSAAPASPGGHIIAVVGGKGGVGKSVFAANFAATLAVDSKNSPIVIDCDPLSTGDIQLILGLKQVVGTGDLLFEGKVNDPRMIATPLKLPNISNPLYFLSLFSNPERILTASEEQIEMALKLMRRYFPVLVVDCGNTLEGGLLKVLDMASMVLVVTNPEVLVLNQTRKIVDKIQTSMIPSDIVKVIINKSPQQTPYNPQFIEQMLKRQVLGVIPDDPATASVCLSKGVPFCLAAPQSAPSKAILQLSRLLIERKVLEQLVRVQRQERPKPKLEVVSTESAASGMRGGRGPKDPRSAFKIRVHSLLIERMDLKKEELDRQISPEKKAELRQRALKIVTDVLQAEDHSWKSREESTQLTKEILDEALGLGPLEDLIADDAVTEIMVNRADQIYLEKAGKPMLSKVTFSSNAQLMAIIERIVNPLGRRIDEKNPYVDARLADGSRVHAIIPPLALDGPMVTIRKFPKKRLGPEDLVKFGSMTADMANFLQACIEARLNVLISGGTGSGKTTLLNVLSGFIPASERILTVEDAAELQLQQEHVGRLETRPANIEGTGAVTIRDLVRQTLRMRPDRIIIGEVRAGEALDMLQAMNTGHDGSMATVHSNSPREALARLETLVMMAGMELPVKAIREQIAGAVHLVVQQSRLSDGARKVTYITEVGGMQGDVITTQDIFVYKQEGIDKNRKVVGKHMATGFIPKFVERIEALGIKIPRGLFKAS